MEITSRDNRLIKQVRRLFADARYRRETGLFAIEGGRLCRDAAASGVGIQAFFYTAKSASQYRDVLDSLKAVCKSWYEIPGELAACMGDTETPQGIFCICAALDNCLPYDKISKNPHGTDLRLLALEDIQDPANLGAVIRTAEALGLNGLVLSAGCCDIYNPKVLRGSMGGVFRLPLYMAGDMAEAAAVLRTQGWRCLACVPDRLALSVNKAALGAGTLCFIGNEGSGLRPATIAACDEAVTIPMAGRAESLNASMAAGLIMWEMVRP